MPDSFGAPRAVLVTGGARGIGLGVARICLRRGWRVALTATSAEGAQAAVDRLVLEEELAPHVIHPLALQVQDPDAWPEALDAAEAALGPLSALVANAGVSPRREGRKVPFAAEGDEPFWADTFAVNVEGAIHGARLLSRRLIARKAPGAIVMMSSIVGVSTVPMVSSYYTASKAALLGFVRAAAHDLGPHGIRLNAVNPGRIDSDLVRLSGAAANEAIAAQTALGRLGHAEEVGEAVEFLLSDRASFITGTRLNVTGGWVES